VSYQEQLDILDKKWKARAGEGFLLDGATDEELAELTTKANDKLQITLPADYLDFLRFSNCFGFNCLNLYGHERYWDGDDFDEGIVEANLDFWAEESLQQYVAFGDENTTRLVLNKTTDKFEIVDSVSWDKIEEFTSFTDMLVFAIKEVC